MPGTTKVVLKLLEAPRAGALAPINKAVSLAKFTTPRVNHALEGFSARTLSIRPLTRTEEFGMKIKKFFKDSDKMKKLGIGAAIGGCTALTGLALYHFFSDPDQNAKAFGDTLSQSVSDLERQINQLEESASMPLRVGYGYSSGLASAAESTAKQFSILAQQLERAEGNRYDDTRNIVHQLVLTYKSLLGFESCMDLSTAFEVSKLRRLVELGFGNYDDDYSFSHERLGVMLSKPGTDTDLRGQFDSTMTLLAQVSFN
jgi:outer membrane murein-binding lipoprotein Lpp